MGMTKTNDFTWRAEVPPPPQDCKVAVLVDCDNVSPEIVDQALLMGAQFGRVVLRGGYGNHATLANRWQEVMVQQAFTPCATHVTNSSSGRAFLLLGHVTPLVSTN